MSRSEAVYVADAMDETDRMVNHPSVRSGVHKAGLTLTNAEHLAMLCEVLSDLDRALSPYGTSLHELTDRSEPEQVEESDF